MELSPLSKAIPNWDAPTLQGFDLNNLQVGQRVKSSSRQFVRFYNKTIPEVVTVEAKINEKTGQSTPIKTEVRHRTIECVHIVTPGDKNEFDDTACDYHRREHWAAYKAFREGRNAPIGTSLDEATFIAPAVATELRFLGCHTIEQLADGSDMLCGQIPNGWELREFARSFAKAQVDNKNNEQVNALKAELERNQKSILQMQEQMDQMRALVDARGQPIQASTYKPEAVKPKRIRRTKAQIEADKLKEQMVTE